MFTTEEIIVRNKFVYKFSVTVRRVKVSSFYGLNEVSLLLVTACWIYKTWTKNFEVCFKQWYFNATEFEIILDGQKLNFFKKKCLIVVSVVFTASFSNAETINHVNYISKGNGMQDFIIVNMLLC